MKQIDSRSPDFCVYCGGPVESRDHIPPKAFLDAPYPENLPVVSACIKCNNFFSLDEEYVACLIECMSLGTIDIQKLKREKIKRILQKKPSISTKIAQCFRDNTIVLEEDLDRLELLMRKLAMGHMAFELNTPRLTQPSELHVRPLRSMPSLERKGFESPSLTPFFPEAASRAMKRIATGDSGWIIVQPERYRYMTHVGIELEVRIVIGECLAGTVCWG